MSGLIRNFNSNYIASGNKLTNRPRKVIALVENESDIPFWSDLLNGNSFGLILEFTPYTSSQAIATTTKGKGHLLKMHGNLGPHLIACVDSDYDYLLPTLTDNAKIINSSSYILQTYAYSVENYNCYAPGLNKLCTNSVKQAVHYNFEGLLEKYSGIIYPLFVWSLLLESKECGLSTLTLPRTKAVKFMMSNNSITQKGEDDFLNEIHESVSQKITKLEQQFSEYSKLLESFKNDLKSRGLIEENTYLFVRGHDMQKFLLTKILEPISMEKYVAHIESIDQQHQHKAKAKKEFASLRLGLSSLIRVHFEYKSSSLFTNLLKPSIDALLSDLDKTVAC